MAKQKTIEAQHPARKFFLALFRKKPLLEEKEIASRLLKTANEAAPPKSSLKCVQKLFGSGYRLTVDYGFKYALAGIVLEVTPLEMGTRLLMRSGRMNGDYFFYSIHKRTDGELADFERLMRAEIAYHNKNLAKYPTKCSDLAKLGEDGLFGYPVSTKKTAVRAGALTALALAFMLSLQGCSSSEKPGTDSHRGDGRMESPTTTSHAARMALKADLSILK